MSSSAEYELLDWGGPLRRPTSSRAAAAAAAASRAATTKTIIEHHVISLMEQNRVPYLTPIKTARVRDTFPKEGNLLSPQKIAYFLH